VEFDALLEDALVKCPAFVLVALADMQAQQRGWLKCRHSASRRANGAVWSNYVISGPQVKPFVCPPEVLRLC
jgi:hypothetical protein